MNLIEARQLLSITEKDDLRSLKKKYHCLMSETHPDVLGSEDPKYIEQAQRINEAYRLLKSHPQAFAPMEERVLKHRQPVWTGAVNERAFRARKVYLYYSMEVEEGHPYYQAANGKYLWDPEEEDFRLFLISVHELTKELLEESGGNVQVKSRLFQYLAEQFIDPVQILRKLAKPERRDAQGREIYGFMAHLKMDRRRILSEDELLYPKSFRGNQILVQDRARQECGYLTFEEDWIYFCVIPLLKEKMAKIKMQMQKGKVHVYFRLENNVADYRIPDRNLEIAKLLAV